MAVLSSLDDDLLVDQIEDCLSIHWLVPGIALHSASLSLALSICLMQSLHPWLFAYRSAFPWDRVVIARKHETGCACTSEVVRSSASVTSLPETGARPRDWQRRRLGWRARRLIGYCSCTRKLSITLSQPCHRPPARRVASHCIGQRNLIGSTSAMHC